MRSDWVLLHQQEINVITALQITAVLQLRCLGCLTHPSSQGFPNHELRCHRCKCRTMPSSSSPLSQRQGTGFSRPGLVRSHEVPFLTVLPMHPQETCISPAMKPQLQWAQRQIQQLQPHAQCSPSPAGEAPCTALIPQTEPDSHLKTLFQLTRHT